MIEYSKHTDTLVQQIKRDISDGNSGCMG